MGDFSLGERIFVPGVLLLFALMSGSFMRGVGGTTTRMEIVFRYATLFMAGALYSIAWMDILAKACGYENAWIVVSVGFAILSIALCTLHLKRRAE